MIEILGNKPGILIGLAFIFALSACGGGGSGGNSDTDGNDVSANGVWVGDLTQAGFDYDVTALIHDGRIMLVQYQFRSGYDGSYTVEGENISADLTEYSDLGLIFGYTLLGEVSEEDTISGLREGPGSQASVQLTFQEEYDRNSSLSLLEGVWDDSREIIPVPNPFTTDLTIEADGSFSGTDDNLCAIQGNINIIDSSNNLYDVDMVIGGCADGGTYTGFARLVEFDPHDMLAIVAFSNTNMVFYNLNWSEVSNGGVLTNDVPVDGLSGTVGSRIYYTFTVSEADLAAAGPDPQFQVVVSGGAGDVDLYAWFEDVPSVVSAFRCLWFQVDPGNDESCDFDVTEAGIFHVMLHADADYSGVSLAASFPAD